MKSTQSPDLNSLRIFLEVARTESFSSAAHRLHLPPSTVSRRLLELETVLGTAVLLRSTRRVSLTEAGRQLLDSISGALETVERGIANFRPVDGAVRGRLRVATSFSFGRVFLPSILARYAELCPEVQVDVQTTHQNIDLIGESVDVALRMGQPADSDMIYRKIGIVEQRLYAAPAFCSGLALSGPEDLRDVALVAHRTRMRRELVHWTLSNGTRHFTVEQPPAIVVDDPILVEGLLSQGLGIGLLSDVLAADGVATGQLVPVLPGWSGPPVPLYYLYHQQLGDLPKVAEFLKATRETLRTKSARPDAETITT
ncbi:LysR family transcriptional regulator [Rhizobium lentis]|uniref:HTH-type transcriptional regulator TtuA n=1 Tax=Rhizobium lentis TaxID=1138194 RepID=A0A7W8UJP7_9HYPH|nr:LysR family transcriptional regulator [Rhizobium lentis]MBB4572232.1 DNA-binding transcriptional LysR family regulator [Rhizobium lentis]MBB5548576.1 DNA-binding transcriptional LysR family regulator [Rhizobium lentis]MBB5559108.1 DNA-binding transcriptional LysR family regulator [Rhizobium lentis]MBB5565370.1 DNA-binding transcriptional LysR family regulator [Rhizobium lentis]